MTKKAQVQDMANEDRSKALEAALGQIEKQFGKGSIMKMGDNLSMNVEAISTGSLALDMALGVGGLPKGRIVEVYGPESSGKSTLALHVVAEAQRNGGLAPTLTLSTHSTRSTLAQSVLTSTSSTSASPTPVSRPWKLLTR